MKITTICVVFGTLVAPGSMLASLSETFSHTTLPTAVPLIDHLLVDNFTLPEFNTSLGTLTGVSIKLTDGTTPVIDIDNETGGPQSFVGSASIPLQITGPSGLVTFVTAYYANLLTTAPVGLSLYRGPTDTSTAITTVPSAEFRFFESPGTGAASFATLTGPGTYTGTAAEGVFFGGYGVASATTSITYTYEAAMTTTPEPTLLVSLGVGLFGVGLGNRRRLGVMMTPNR